jgi:molybdopterin-binding protein
MTLLASEICVLSSGRVVARGRPEEVFGGLASSTLEGGEQIVNVFRGRVGSVADSLAMVEIEPDLAVAVADEGNYAVGQRVAFELRAADVLLGLGRSTRLSAQNVLVATVQQVHRPLAGDSHSPVVVTTALGRMAVPVAVIVSQRASRELGLAPGLGVQLVFKAQACRLLAAY